MTHSTCETHHDALAALGEGRFDDVTDEQIAAAEEHLNQCEDCAASLRDQKPNSEAAFRSDAHTPSDAQWETVWSRIEAMGANRHDHGVPFAKRRLRVAWAGLSVAALLAIGVTVGEFARGPDGSLGELRLATAGDVEIESVEVFGSSELIVLNSGDQSEPSIIWIMEEPGA